MRMLGGGGGTGREFGLDYRSNRLRVVLFSDCEDNLHHALNVTIGNVCQQKCIR